LQRPFVTLHLALPTLQRFLSSIKEWGRYGGVWWKAVQYPVMGKLKQIRILSLKFWSVASLPPEYKELL
jgi:hypothetical protein